MDKRILGGDLEVSGLGLGCMGFSHAYGEPVDEATGIDAIRYAYDIGYRFFDTAECYGPYENEELVGKALNGRKDAVIATKFGVTLKGVTPTPDSRPEVIRKSVEGSLKRLGVEAIDLYYQHRPDPKVEPETVAQVMKELAAEGKILHWGISEASQEYIERADAIFHVTAIQNRYSMMWRDYESYFPMLEKRKIGFVAFSPLANGLLSRAYDASSTFDPKSNYRASMPQYAPGAYEENRKLFSLLDDLASSHNTTPAVVSLAWMMAKKDYIVPIPGTRKKERMLENARASELKLSSQDVAAIDEALSSMTMSAVFGGHK